ncbi:MAG: BolA family protein [Gammaproteobacteria bacterium]|nr:BolA family transcriptional regulator [Gammaproteobacteria bacterium]GBF29319.1 DNA-binding transcriptional regulator BolA [bacterium MnTg03]
MTMQQTIESRLNSSFSIEHLAIENESHMHNVAPGSESHFKVTIVSEDFRELMLIKRHRLVNKALEQELQTIHALALHTMTPDEWLTRAGKVADSPQCRGGGKNQ